MEGEMKNLVKVWISILASLCYCHFIASKIPKGNLRLLSLLPIIVLFTIIPLFLSYVFPIGITFLFISWLCNFKLLLFAFGQGPLSSDPPKSLLHFILAASLPIKISQNQDYPYAKTPKLPLNWPTKVLISAILVSLHDHKDLVSTKILLLFYSCLTYFLIDIVFGVSNAIIRAMLGLELVAPSNEPYLSTSLQDFWSRRWDLMVSDILRDTIYKPMRWYCGKVLGPDWAPLPAVLVAFLVSGLMHELLFFYIARVSPSWEMTSYFVLHGVCVVVELGVKRTLVGKWRLHWAVSAPLTVGFVLATAMWLFFPPLIRNGVTVRAIEECKALLDFVKNLLHKIF
ncbi:hypothetical protein SLA2020_305050 [Shorea laevis]